MMEIAAKPLTIAIDAMGGDYAPQMVVEGVSRVTKRMKDVRFLLFGRSDEVAPLVDRFRRLSSRVELREASDIIAGTERPSMALRNGRNSSMPLRARSQSHLSRDGAALPHRSAASAALQTAR